MMNKFLSLFTLFVFFLTGPSLKGQEQTMMVDTLAPFDHTLEEVVVAAFNRTQRIIEVPGSLSYIGAVLIDKEKPDYNILPILHYAPGVFAHTGATNTNRISIRGIGARVPYATGKIRAYFNNIPLTNTSGITFIQDIDPSVIESMEIIKGPATSVYGAGLGGTITMTARQPFARSTGLSNTFQMGSFGLIRNNIIGDYSSESFASTLAFTHIQSDGYRENNEFRRNTITSVTQYQPSENMSFTSLLAFTDLRSHIPSSIDSITYMDSPQSAAANWLKTRGYEDAVRFLGGVTGSARIRENLSADLSLFTIWHDEKELRPFDVFYEDRLTVGTRYKSIYSVSVNPFAIEITTGGELFLEQYNYSNFQNIEGEGVQGEQFSNNRENVRTINYFIQTDATRNNLTISGGLNLNYTHIDYVDLFHEEELNLSGNYNYGFILSPRISANYVYYLRNSLFVTLSHGFAPPSLAETLTPEGFINPDIRPEKSWNLELGLRGNVQSGQVFYDISVYQMRVQDLLVAERVGGDAWVGKNAGESLHRGLEAELHWVLMQDFGAQRFSLNEISIRGNYSYNDFRFTDFVDRENDYTGYLIPGVPDQVMFLSLYTETGNGLYFMPSLRFVGPMAMNDPNTRFTQSYNVVDALVGFKSTLRNRWGMDIFLRIQNIFNEQYASMILVNAPSFGNTAPRYYYPGLPLHYNMGLRVHL